MTRDRSTERRLYPTLRERFAVFWSSKRAMRLASSLDSFEIELRAKLEVSLVRPQAPSQDDFSSQLEAARNCVRVGDLEAGWRIFHVLQRLAVDRKDENEVIAEIAARRIEMREKLRGWRRETGAALLDQKALESPRPPTRETEATLRANLKQALFVLHEHYETEGYKDSLRRTGAVQLTMVMLAALGGLFFLTWSGAVPAFVSNGTKDAVDLQSLCVVANFGVLGAGFSAITDTAQGPSSARIPELVATWRMTLLRTCLGAVSGIMMFLIVKSKLFFNFENASGVLIIAFASGLSERLVPRLVNALVQKPEKAGP